MQAWEELAYARRDGREEAKKAAETEKKEAAAKLKSAEVPIRIIAESLGLSDEEVLELE